MGKKDAEIRKDAHEKTLRRQGFKASWRCLPNCANSPLPRMQIGPRLLLARSRYPKWHELGMFLLHLISCFRYLAVNTELTIDCRIIFKSLISKEFSTSQEIEKTIHQTGYTSGVGWGVEAFQLHPQTAWHSPTYRAAAVPPTKCLVRCGFRANLRLNDTVGY